MSKPRLDARSAIGSHDVLLITFDTLRYDVAERARIAGQTPFLASLLPDDGWERRHSPGSFTYSAHHAFFAGFLPTPPSPGLHPRLFAARFPGAESVDDQTYCFDAADLPTGLGAAGYHTLCIGGVGFFNQQSELGSVLPNRFAEAHWREDFGVTSRHSTAAQVGQAVRSIRAQPDHRRLFVFLNVSALHQPNCIFVDHADSNAIATTDTPATQGAALGYVDSQLQPLFDSLGRRAPLLAVLCSDHGTAYGEAGHRGHRLAHDVVWNVPYAEMILPQLEPKP